MRIAVVNGWILNCLPSPEQERDWRFEHAQNAQIIPAQITLPVSVDYREPWWSVESQGHTGSCVGWATADSVLRWHFTKSGELSAGDRLSTRFSWMAAKETDTITARPTGFIELAGTHIKAALDVARKFGSVTETELPFDPSVLFLGEEIEFMRARPD